MRQAAARDDSFELATASSDGENGDRRGALSSVVEHFLHTEGVAGSSPAARTSLDPLLPTFQRGSTLRLVSALRQTAPS